MSYPLLIMLVEAVVLLPILAITYYQKKKETNERRFRDLIAENNEMRDILAHLPNGGRSNEQTQVSELEYLVPEGTPEEERMLALLQEVGRKHQFRVEEIKRDDNWITCSIRYQDQFFISYCSTDTDEILIEAPAGHPIPYSQKNFDMVRTICHKLTSESRYAKFVYQYDQERNQFYIRINLELLLPDEQTIMSQLRNYFRCAQELKDALHNPPGSAIELFDSLRDVRMLTDAELMHERDIFQAIHPHAFEPNNGTLREYISYLFNGEQVADLLSLTIQNADGTSVITQRDKIAGFNLLSAIVEGEGENAHFRGTTPAVLTIDAVTNHYVFTLHPLESNQAMLSVRMTAVCTPHEYLQDYVPDAIYVPEAVSMRLGYVRDELPPSEHEDDAERPACNFDKQMRHGHELMQQEYYLQAITVLTPLFRKLMPKFFLLNDRKNQQFFSLCYDLGFCYTELRQFEKAFYYLDLVRHHGRFDYSEEYFNCLVNGGDVRSYRDLRSEMDDICKQINDIDDDEDCGTEEMIERREGLVNYHAFLQRRLGIAEIHFGDLTLAERTFTQLLKHEPSHEYAEQKLKYIEQLREKKNSHK